MTDYKKEDTNIHEGLASAPLIAEASEGTSNPRPGLKQRTRQAIASYKEWRGLPGKIRKIHPQARKDLENIQRSLMEYRLVLIKLEYRAVHIDSSIWEKYHALFDEFYRLEKNTNQRFLALKRLSLLRQVHADWQVQMQGGQDLMVEIKDAPASFEFYNKMMVHKMGRMREKLLSEELTQQFARAYQSLENAIEYVEKFNRENDISIFGASILNIEDARQHWDERLTLIHDMEARHEAPEKIIAEIDKLKDAMYAAPTLAKWIHEIEQRFNRLKYDHELLVESYGKAVIPNLELEENNTIITEMVPRLWASGQREQLDHYLHGLETFLEIYEPEVHSELSFAERHSVRRIPGESGGQSQEQQFQQLIDLTKILVSAIEARESTMSNHSVVVSKLCVDIGREMGWLPQDLRMLEVAGLLHDIGKVWIPESILNKEETLADDEVEQIKKHPLYGAQILEAFDSFKEIAPWVYYHQERWDGLGYPEGLRGDEIPPAARIIAVAEAYNAMTAGHNSRKALTSVTALEEIEKEAGMAFDPRVVEAFARTLQKK